GQAHHPSRRVEMFEEQSPITSLHQRTAGARSFPDRGMMRPPLTTPRHFLFEVLLVVAALVLVFLIALLEYATGPFFSCALFYFIPVVACAWWGGFAPGILLPL